MFKRIVQQMNQQNDPEGRNKMGVLTSKIGLIINFILFVIKAVAGLMAGSLSILADAMNNLSDSASSIMILIGFRYAAKPADKEHPYGHERSEYISGLFVSILIIVLGYQFLITSISKILNPEATQSNFIVLFILFISILVKIIHAQFTKEMGKYMESNTILAVAQDSINDVYITALVLLSTLIERNTAWMIDGIVGLFIAIYIIWSGIETIRDSIDDLLGSRPNQELIKQIQAILDSYDVLVGYHDLLVHRYGPNKIYASIHIEIDDTMSLVEAHKIIHQIEDEVEAKLAIRFVSHIDPIAIQDEEISLIYRHIKSIIKDIDPKLKFHDFQVIDGKINFDIVIPEELIINQNDIDLKIQEEVIEKIGNYKVEINFENIYLLND